MAGVDAGINTGFAILNLQGVLITSGCMKEASDERIVKIITDVGTPVLIAADTNPPSHFVQKIAARLNVRVCIPSESMSKAEKRAIGADLDDPHVRDAYAAAVKAFRRYQNRLRQIDRLRLPESEKEELKRMAIIGKRLSERLQKGPKRALDD